MATANVEFYEKLKHLQEQKIESERRRLLLEQQLRMNASSENKAHALRVAQLQNYWRKLCEDEKRSQRRNEQLLRDLDRISEHAARFAERTEKLKTLKFEYETYIEKTYPNWKEKVMNRRQQRMRANSNAQQIYTGPRLAQNEQSVHFGDGSDYNQIISNGRLSGFVQPNSEGSDLTQQPGHNGFDHQNLDRIRFSEQQPKQSADIYPGLNGSAYPFPGPNGPTNLYPVTSGHANLYPGQTVPYHSGPNGSAQQYPEAREHNQPQRPTEFQQPAESGEMQQKNERNGADVDDASEDAHSSLSEERPVVGSDQNKDGNRELLKSQSIQRRADDRRTSADYNRTKASIESPAIGSYGASNNSNISPIRDLTSKDQMPNPVKGRASNDQTLKTSITGPTKDPSFNNNVQVSAKSLASDSPSKQSDSLSPISSPEKRNVKDQLHSIEAKDVRASHGNKKDDGADNIEQKEEIQTDRTYATEMSDFEEDVVHNFNLSNSADAMILRHQGKSISVPAPDVSLQGFCRLLKAVEDDVSRGRSPKFYFRSPTPRASVIQEIIENANRGSPLTHLNVESIAMVILEQLPCLSMNSRNFCLLTDKILTLYNGEVNDRVVRQRLDPSDHLFWDSLYNHFIILLQYKILSVTEIAEIFSPLLISGKSKQQKQAVALVTKILEGVSDDELIVATPRSTSDFSLVSPHPARDGTKVSRPVLQSGKSSTATLDQKQKVSAAAKQPSPSSPSLVPHHSTPLIPGLPLGSSLDDEGLPMSRDPQTTLTQTAAYKQLLASTSITNKLPDMDSDEDDEIEKNLSQHFSNPRPTAANRTSEESFKSPKSPDNLKSPKSPKSDSIRSNFSDESLKQEIDRKNSLVLKSASLKSGRSAVESIIHRVHEDFDLDDDDDDQPIPNSSLTKSNNVQVKEAKNDDDDDFWL